MSNKIPPEIEKQITDRSDELTLKMPIDNDYQVGYVKGFEAGHESGATEWAGRAQELADALEWIRVYGPGGELTNKFIDNALAKYKEVGNDR